MERHRTTNTLNIFDDIGKAFTTGFDVVKSEFTGKEPTELTKLIKENDKDEVYKDVDIIAHDIEKNVKLIPKELEQEPKVLEDVGEQFQDVFEGKQKIGTALKNSLKDVTGGGKKGGLDLLAIPSFGTSQLLNKDSFIRSTAKDLNFKPVTEIGKDVDKISDVGEKALNDAQKIAETGVKAIDFLANNSTLLLIGGAFIAYKIVTK